MRYIGQCVNIDGERIRIMKYAVEEDEQRSTVADRTRGGTGGRSGRVARPGEEHVDGNVEDGVPMGTTCAPKVVH